MGISVYGIGKFCLIKKPLGVGKGRVAVTIPVKILALPKRGRGGGVLIMSRFFVDFILCTKTNIKCQWTLISDKYLPKKRYFPPKNYHFSQLVKNFP